MAEDEEFVAREELLDLGNFVRRDCGNGVALILFGVASEEDAGGFFYASDKFHLLILFPQICQSFATCFDGFCFKKFLHSRPGGFVNHLRHGKRFSVVKIRQSACGVDRE